MSLPKHLARQADFSAGQLEESALRAGDKPFVRAGARRMENFRLLATGVAEQRPGRRAAFLSDGRTEEVRMAPGSLFKLCFRSGFLEIRTSATDAIVATAGSRPWTTATAANVRWVRADNVIYIFFPGSRPITATWNGGTSWSITTFDFLVSDGKRYQPYKRFASAGVTMAVSALSGTGISLTIAGEDVFEAGHVGVHFRYVNRQMEIASVIDARHATANVIEELPPAYLLEVETKGFRVGDAVTGTVSGTKGVIQAIGTGTVTVQVLNNFGGFDTASDKLIGPFARSAITTQTLIATPSDAPTTLWDEAVCSNVRGWPRSGFSDQNRLGMCDIPAVLNGIMWSAIGSPQNFLPGDEPDSAIFETLNSPDRVYHVVPGPDEFVLTDRGVKYIPISETNPLKPGSVSFRDIAAPAAAPVQPVATADGALYVDTGQARMVAIVPTGQTTAPYTTRDVSEYHASLFKTPIAIAATTGDQSVRERYIYVLNSDGTMAVGRFDAAKEWVGWVPWSGPGAVKWVGGLDNRLLLTTLYQPNGVSRYVVELLDGSVYLDAYVEINNVLSAISPAPGYGPLWWMASSTVDVMDGRRYLGRRQVNAAGFVIEEEGEDLSGASIVAGLNFECTFIPFIQHAGEGQSAKQTLRRRKVSRFGVTVQNSCGFLYNGNRRIGPWVVGENQSGQPPLRDKSYVFPGPRKRDFDPEVPIVRDIPGPLRLVEIGYEVTV